MSRRTSVIGIAVLVALALSAFAAAGASAEDRAFLCEANTTTGAEKFSDAHCIVAATGNVGFKHTLPPSGANAITGTNAKTASSTTAAAKSILKGTLSGLETELECTTVGGSGSLTNAATSVSGTGTIEYTGCTVLKPAGRGCKVTGNAVTTKSLSATTVGVAGTGLKFSPASGTEFAGVSLENCLNNKPPTAVYPVSGSLIASTSGATTTTTEAGITGQGTLTFGGNPAGLEGAITISKGTVALTLTP